VSDGAAWQSRYHVGVTAVPYTVDREAGRVTIEPSLTGEATLVVRAPADATAADVESALDDRRAWLLDSLYGRADPDRDRAFASGESLCYGGRRRPLRVSESRVDEPSLQFDGARFVLRVPRDGDAGASERRRAVVDWYRARAAELLPDCVREVARGRPVPTITVDDVGRRWVRVDGADRLRLHWRLVLTPRPVAAYAAVHALVRRDHDPDEPAFWRAVDALVPNARSRERWLRLNGARLRL